MSDAAAAISLRLSAPAGSPGEKTREQGAEAFSFAGALTALEIRAAQSLKSHGARPDGAIGEEQRKTGAGAPSPERAPAAPSAPSGPADAARNETPAPADRALANNAPAQGKPQAGAPASAAAAVAIVPHAGAGAPAPQLNSAPAPVRPENAAARPVDLARPEKTPRAPAPVPAPAAPSTENFARLIARRLDQGATQFELRLDPPALGKVEAALRVNDQGDAVLTLKFEQQASLDLFARDEAALRAALGEAGIDLDGQALAFLLADDEEKSASASSDDDARTQAQSPVAADPRAFAADSGGTIDLLL